MLAAILNLLKTKVFLNQPARHLVPVSHASRSLQVHPENKKQKHQPRLVELVNLMFPIKLHFQIDKNLHQDNELSIYAFLSNKTTFDLDV